MYGLTPFLTTFCLMLAVATAGLGADPRTPADAKEPFPADSAGRVALGPVPRGRGIELRSGYRLDPSSHYRNGSDVTVQRVSGGAAVRRPIFDAVVAALEADTDYADYSFNRRDDTPFGASGFMHDAVSFRLGTMLVGPLKGAWTWQAGGSVSVAGETRADLWEAFNGSALAGVGYLVSTNLRLTLSTVVFGFESTVPVLPVPGVDWTINPAWRLLTPGPGLDLVRTLGPASKLTLRGRWEYRQYRLDDDPPAPGGMFYDQRVRMGLEWSRRFFHVVEAAVEGGAYVYQQLQLRNRFDSKVANTDGGPSAYAAVRLGVRL